LTTEKMESFMSGDVLSAILSNMPVGVAGDGAAPWFYNLPWPQYATGAALGIAGCWALSRLFHEEHRDRHIAGRRLVSLKEARAQAARRRRRGDKGQAWGGVQLPTEAEELFSLIAGSIGSGKTKHLVNWLASVVPTIVPYTPDGAAGAASLPPIDGRLFAFDPKNELYSLLHSLQPRVPVLNLTASDLRSSPINLAAEVTDPAGCLEAAANLFPADQHESNPFWSLSVRNLFAGVLLYLVAIAPGDFTLRDAVLILCNEWYLRQVLEGVPDNRHLLKLLEQEDVWRSIAATVASKVAELRIVAAYWHHANRKPVSLRRWVEADNSILFLGQDSRIKTALEALGRFIMKRLSDSVLACPEGTAKRTYFALDEFTALGGDHPLPGIADLCLRGRGPGARLVIIIQTIEALRKIYTREGAHALAGQFANKLLLRAEDPAHAEWCSEVVGDYEVWELEETISYGRGGRTVTRRWNRVKRRRLLPSQFMTVAPPNPTNGLQGFGLSPYVNGVWPILIPGDWVDAHLPKANPFVPAYLPRPPEHQYLPPFADADLARLKLRPEPPALPRRRAI
jgi:hypothetical protein